MAELSVLYATALFDLAVEGDAVDAFLEQSVFIRDTLQDDECRHVLVHPHISSREKREVFGKAFEGRVHSDLLGFLYLVIDKNREAFLLPSLTALIGMIERHQGKVTAKVLSATELREEQVTALEKLLSQKLNKQVDIAMKVDPSVIGGLYIYVDRYFIDRTVKSLLHDMTASMKEGCGA